MYYVISSYLEHSVGERNVGTVYALTYIALLILLLNFHKIIKKFGKSRTFFVLQFVKIVILTMLGLLPLSVIDAPLIVGYLMLSYVTWVEMDIILESFSMDKVSGRIRGVYLALHSLGYMIGPIVSTQLLQEFGYASVFFFGMVLNAIFFLITLLNFRMMKAEMREVPNIRGLVAKMLENKDFRGIYVISLVLELFYALMVIYMPMHLLDRGFSWGQIGLILSLIHIPFIFLQYPAGILADRKIGEKEMIVASLALLGISTLSLYFIESSSFTVWLGILMLTRVGASVVDILRDSYFYKKVDAGDIDLIDFFRTTGPVAFIIVPVVASVSFFFFSMNSIFILVGSSVLLGVIPALGLVDNISEEEALRKNGALNMNKSWNFWSILGKRFIISKATRNGRF